LPVEVAAVGWWRRLNGRILFPVPELVSTADDNEQSDKDDDDDDEKGRQHGSKYCGQTSSGSVREGRMLHGGLVDTGG